MLGIWHGGDLLKEISGSAQSMVEWYVELSDLVGISYVNKTYSFIVIHL